MVDIKAEELEDFVTKRLAYEIYRRPDLVDVYNSVNPIDKSKNLDIIYGVLRRRSITRQKR